MSEKDKEILEKVAKALPHMNEFDKGVLVGTAEAHMQKEGAADEKHAANL